MATINITPLELEGLKAITKADFYENGRNSCPWDFSVYDNMSIKGKKRSGLFSSLSQKGLVTIYEAEKKWNVKADGSKVRNPYWEKGGVNFGSLQITELGYQTLDELNLIDEDGYFID